MNGIYRRYSPMFFGLVDPERSHGLALDMLAATRRAPGGPALLATLAPAPDERLRLRVWDLPFANPLGVAAGMDKNAIAVEPFIALGFGHVEAGTVTLRPQPGNESPRVWRVPECEAVINALGFPSKGAAAVRTTLEKLRPRGVVGINIGKNRDTSSEEAASDYASLVMALFDVAHYFTVNISSPNTPGLRSLQMADELARLLAAVRDANQMTADIRQRDPRPILIKIAPDLTPAELEGVAEAAVANGAVGIVATNTTTSRDGIPDRYADLPGGLSGPPLRDRANEVTKILYRKVGNQVPIIGVGGISTGADALQRIRAGATLVQVYTATIYAGPGLAGQILSDMSDYLDREGLRSITDLVGVDA